MPVYNIIDSMNNTRENSTFEYIEYATGNITGHTWNLESRSRECNRRTRVTPKKRYSNIYGINREGCNDRDAIWQDAIDMRFVDARRRVPRVEIIIDYRRGMVNDVS